ncbi:glycosyltransferase family 2 protein [Limosilactobacillus ingluviei]|uniref:glycosyltransferase family 2 protein n=1 Tax=Limosilactobacillus ingluviei TaxID=148604 RepID=UPI0002D5F221|nr:glycosyltransferase [Limosilactobacillus ingluviei]
MSDLVSILIPVYNEPIEYIRQAVDSIRYQTYKNLELVIIIDNPDHHEAIEYLTSISNNDARVRVYTNEQNLGLPKTLNKAIDLSHGSLIARMDADDWSTEKRIESQVEYINNFGVDLVASNVVDMDESGNLLGTGTKYPISSRGINNYLKYGDCLPHPTWLGKRRIFENLAGYREIEACEDYDFVVRGAILRYSYGLIVEPLVRYRINMKGISQTKKVKQIAASKIIQKNYRLGCITPIDDLQSVALNSKKSKASFDNLKNKIMRKWCLIKYS